MSKTLSDDQHIISSIVDPKLRMLANCSQEVNLVRSEFQGNLSVKGKPKTKPVRFENLSTLPELIPKFRKKKTNDPPNQVLTNVFIRVDLYKTDYTIPGEISRKGNLISACMPISSIFKTINKNSGNNGILSIESSRSLQYPNPIVNNKYEPKPVNNVLKQFRAKYRKVNQVIIGIIDVGGFDFSHPEFLDKEENTRFYKIWDQGGNFRSSPELFGYGSEFSQDQLNNAIQYSKKSNIPAYLIEKQSGISIGSHGTHVASIAAGNSGVCPDAIIVGVLIALKDSDLDRRKSFYDSSCIVHAVEYLTLIAKEKGLPLSINISLGTNGHAHDGSDAASRWIDEELLIPGRCVTVAAGNAGQDEPESNDDYGHVVGRIHTSGKIKAQGLSENIKWCVAGNGISDVSENEMEIWYGCQDRFSVMIKPPDLDWIGPVTSNGFIENMQLKDGSFISIYNDLYHPSNGSNIISIYLSPNLNTDQIFPIRSGIWQIRIIGDEIRNGDYHAWIERDDPRPLGPVGENKNLWNFPSFFTRESNVDNTSISSLACARYVISVGNLDKLTEKINVSSSQGPTRDNRLKPEVIAPGTNITAAKGFSGNNDLWISMTGTSMSAPIVCGVAAQMLSVEPKLTAAQISGIMVRTSKPLPGFDYKWQNDYGYGLIQAQECVQESINIFNKTDLKP